jgi:hypothetical protein
MVCSKTPRSEWQQCTHDSKELYLVPSGLKRFQAVSYAHLNSDMIPPTRFDLL